MTKPEPAAIALLAMETDIWIPRTGLLQFVVVDSEFVDWAMHAVAAQITTMRVDNRYFIFKLET